MNTPFHLAFPVNDLNETKQFYCGLLNCTVGRTASNWMDINLYGNQITVHENESTVCSLTFHPNDSMPFPVYHFGLVLPWEEWHELKNKLIAANVKFLIPPKTVFEGEIGEQNTFFLKDPNGYSIEFKSFENPDNLFKGKG